MYLKGVAHTTSTILDYPKIRIMAFFEPYNVNSHFTLMVFGHIGPLNALKLGFNIFLLTSIILPIVNRCHTPNSTILPNLNNLIELKRRRMLNLNYVTETFFNLTLSAII